MEQVVTRFPSHGGSPARSKLIELLKAGNIGDSLTDAQLQACCGMATAPNERGYPALQGAIRYVYRWHTLVWERVPKEGRILCLDPNGIMGSVDRTADHVRKVSRRATQKIKTIALEAVPEADRSKFLSRLSQHATIAMFAKPTTQKKIEGVGPKFDPRKFLESMA